MPRITPTHTRLIDQAADRLTRYLLEAPVQAFTLTSVGDVLAIVLVQLGPLGTLRYVRVSLDTAESWPGAEVVSIPMALLCGMRTTRKARIRDAWRAEVERIVAQAQASVQVAA